MSSPESTQDTFVPFTKAERIQQLNDIDKLINQLLRSAGLALKTLSSSQSTSEMPFQIVSARKQEFERATNSYFTTHQAINVGLRRQILGLEEAGILVEKKEKKANDLKESNGDKPEKDVEAGTGKLDIGWLNSRSGKVGRDNEAELWKKTRQFLEGLDINDKDVRNGRDEIMED